MNKKFLIAACVAFIGIGGLSFISVKESQKHDTVRNTIVEAKKELNELDVNTLAEKDRFSQYLNLVKDATYYEEFTINILNSINNAYQSCNYIQEKYPNSLLVNGNSVFHYDQIGYRLNGEFHVGSYEIRHSGNYHVALYETERDSQGIIKPKRKITNEDFNFNVILDFKPEIATDTFYPQNYNNFDIFKNEIAKSFNKEIAILNDTELKSVYNKFYQSEYLKPEYFSLRFTYEGFEYEQELIMRSLDYTKFKKTPEEIMGKKSGIYNDSFSHLLKNTNNVYPGQIFAKQIDFNEILKSDGGQTYTIKDINEKIDNVIFKQGTYKVDLQYEISDQTGYLFTFKTVGVFYSEAVQDKCFIHFSNNYGISFVLPRTATYQDIEKSITSYFKKFYLVVGFTVDGNYLSTFDYSYDQSCYTFDFEELYNTELDRTSMGAQNKIKYRVIFRDNEKNPTRTLTREFETYVYLNADETEKNIQTKILTKYNKIILDTIEDIDFKKNQIIVINSAGQKTDGVNTHSDYYTKVYDKIDYSYDYDKQTITITLIVNQGTEKEEKIIKVVSYILKPEVSGFQKFLIEYGDFLRGIF